MSRLAAGLSALAALALVPAPTRAEDAPGIAWPDGAGRATISRPFNGSPITLGVSSRMAGAIDSLTWGGTQFLNAYDHGRELQSAASFDGYGECLNPTEAGSNSDGPGRRSTSRLLRLSLGPDKIETRVQMAYWMRPGERVGHCPKGDGPYGSPLSDDVLTKRVTLGAAGVANAIAYRATFTTAKPHEQATFEAVTGYMPPDFSRFSTYDPATGALAPLSAGPGEQTKPVVLATPDGSRAMGIFSPDLPQPGQQGGYGRFDFSSMPGAGNATVKWNCVFRTNAVPAGDHTYTCYVLVGTLDDVTQGMAALRTALTGKASRQASAPPPPAAPRQDAGPGDGTPLFIGTEPACNAGFVTADREFRDCATSPVGTTLASRTAPDEIALYVGVSPGDGEGVVTTNPRHLNGATQLIGFLRPVGGAGTPLFVGTGQGCNAGVVSTNPGHLNCPSSPIGTLPR